MAKATIAIGLLFAGVLAATSAGAHALSPSLLALREQAGGGVEVTWKIPLVRIMGTELRPIFPADCVVPGPAAVTEESDSLITRWSVACGEAGLVGREIGIEGLGSSKTDALLHVELADGRTIDTVLRRREPSYLIPDREQWIDVARRYVELGIDHIVSGVDHLLFVLGLLLLATDVRALVATVTAFTLGHSVTLTLAVLGIARVPSAPVEVLIAFSIFLLAVELARPGTSVGLMRRKPWLMAGSFGLLHGLGFAAVLRETGLPADSIPLALFCFNVGIEVGQLAFVLGVEALRLSVRALAIPKLAWVRTAVVYAMGSLAVFWMIERAMP
jgi:hydrogenase/urease accessory protein HupE